MDELFASLVSITEAAALRSDSMEDEQWAEFMEERVKLLIQIRRLDAELPDNAPERLRYQEAAKRLADWDAVIMSRMEELKAEAAEHLGKITDFRKQKDAYDGADTAIDSYFVDKKW
ncbi:flagellar protein FliT [Cohnella silvisoli]|uniref:Flagellar protein FliT n=1 Tax=Cohnella silvisoli TaxID=2873699 RepID=A0ABV1KPI3_9BACL|nr:flagellar protein FliT [Cohnella silvisoli]MCD9022326.1 hypothetical protein [Cohnella silvisoli]